MLKQYKLKILITSFITLVPMFVGCILWNKLPDTIATHFDSDNVPNGWSSKPVAVFVIPIVMVALHLICLAVTSADPKYKNIGKKPLGIVFWIVPGVSLLGCGAIYTNALDIKIDSLFIAQIFIGVLIMVLGNILPKVKQNYSFGIKLPWTLNDEDNWNRTNRLAGWCMVIAGIIIIVTSFCKIVWILIPIVIITVGIPTVYSYLLFHKKAKETGK
ncbi:MAG: DUF1648 domain-containing protein [Lachnospiraceae bacterium]|nr:DUF1648 domain-containing protein [Lachnospiraceae bacterium]